MSVLLYASECRKFDIKTEKRPVSFENMRPRGIINVSWRLKVGNAEICLRPGQHLISKVAKKKRWSYFGDTLQVKESATTHQEHRWQLRGLRQKKETEDYTQVQL